MKSGIGILMCVVSCAYVGAMGQKISNSGMRRSSSAPSIRRYVQPLAATRSHVGHFVDSTYISSSDDEDDQNQDEGNRTGFGSGLSRSANVSWADLRQYLAEEEEEDAASSHVGESVFSDEEDAASSHVGESAFSDEEGDSSLGISNVRQGRHAQTASHMVWIEQKRPIARSLSYHFGAAYSDTKQSIKQYFDVLRLFHETRDDLTKHCDYVQHTVIDICLPANEVFLKYWYGCPNSGLTLCYIDTMFAKPKDKALGLFDLPSNGKVRFVDKPGNNENILRVIDLLEDNIHKILQGESSCLTEMRIVSKYGDTVRDFYEKPQISRLQIKR